MVGKQRQSDLLYQKDWYSGDWMVLLSAGMLWLTCLTAPSVAYSEIDSAPAETHSVLFEDMGPAWAENCFQLKKHLSNSAELDVVISSASPVPPEIPFWRLHWSGLDLAIPIADYSHLMLMTDPGCERPGFILKSSTGLLFSAGCMAGLVQNMDDVLAQVDFSTGRSSESLDGKALTAALYGGPVSAFDLMVAGFEVTPADLTCDPLLWREEIAAAIPLILKDIGGPYAPTAAFRDVGRYPGILVRGQQSDQNVWDALIYDPAKMSEAVSISYFVPQVDNYAEAGAIIGHSFSAVEPRPEWLEALEGAMSANELGAWRRFETVLTGTPFSSNSRKSFQSFLQFLKE